MYPSLDETTRMLRTPSTKIYFDRLSRYDLEARKSSTAATYMNRYISSIRPFFQSEKYMLNSMTEHADIITKSFKRFHNIEWKLVKLCCDTENGFPHTLGDTIFLPDDFLIKNTYKQCLETIIHEKVHLYQRMYPLYTNTLITQYWHYNIVGIMDNLESARANPDLNNILYSLTDVNVEVNKINACYSKYDDHPKSLYDAKLTEQCKRDNQKYEHPYEKMAYNIANTFVTNDIEKDNDYIELIRWMKNYF